jgi:hypothetical protein
MRRRRWSGQSRLTLGSSNTSNHGWRNPAPAAWRRKLRGGLIPLLLLMMLTLSFSQDTAATGGSGFPPQLTVSVGYADNARPSPVFPNPWYGASGVTFIGCAPPSSCVYDGGAIKLFNSSDTAITVNRLKVQFSAACVFDIWPQNLSLPAGQTLIYTQTVSGASAGCTNTNGTFDGSDIGPNGSNWAGRCDQSGIVPEVDVTASGATVAFSDVGKVLNTGGIDLADCPAGTNESQPWQVLGPSVPTQRPEQTYGTDDGSGIHALAPVTSRSVV